MKTCAIDDLETELRLKSLEFLGIVRNSLQRDLIDPRSTKRLEIKLFPSFFQKNDFSESDFSTVKKILLHRNILIEPEEHFQPHYQLPQIGFAVLGKKPYTLGDHIQAVADMNFDHQYYKVKIIPSKIEYVLVSNKEWLRSQNQNSSGKIDICINEQSGIYKQGDGTKKYEIAGYRKEYVLKILSEKICSIGDLKNIADQNDQTVSAAIKSINKIFKKKLEVPADLIVHSNTSGYSLNKKAYNFIEISE